MTDRIKELAPLIWDEIQKAHNILLHCHPSPDPDSMGGVLAMMYMLQGLGKEVTVIGGDSEPPPTMSALPGFDQIVAKNYTQIVPGEFDLFIIQDSSAPSQITRKGEVVFPEKLMTVIIDHHATNTGFARLNLVEPDYPAACQIVYELMKIWNVSITPEIAGNLFAGMYSDTGGFKYIKTTRDTLAAAAELAGINPEFTRILFDLENNYAPEQIAFLGLSLTSLEKYFGGRVVLGALPHTVLARHGIKKSDTEKIEVANIIKSVVGWEIGIRFTEVEPEVVTISFRTRSQENYDVGKIAFATGYGGGHASASGATFRMPYDQAKKHLLDTIRKVYPELGDP